MSDRATISVCAGDRLIECRDMRNRSMGDLFVECARIVRAVGDAVEGGDVLSRIGGDPGRRRDEDELRLHEECSEFPVVVDLTQGMAYLRDDYPLGHPGADALPITSVEEYRSICDPYVMWPPERPIPFGVLAELADRLAEGSTDGPFGRGGRSC